MGFKSRNIFNPFAKTDREVRKMADNITKGLFIGGFLGASALKRAVSSQSACPQDRIRKAEMANIAMKSEEQHILDAFLNQCKKHDNNLVITKIRIRLYNTLTTYYTTPESSNLFYALQEILKNKIAKLKTGSIKKECEISIDVLKLLKEGKDAGTIISHIESKYQSPNNADRAREDVVQKNNIIAKLSNSEEQRLLDEYVKKCDSELNIEYMIIYTTAARLMNALKEFYKSPINSGLFNALQDILESKKASVKRKSIKEECNAAIEVLQLLREGNSVDNVVEHMCQKYPPKDI